MRDFFNIFVYTIAENARKKVFIISTIIILFMTVALFNVPALMKYFENNGKNTQNSSEQSGDKEKKNSIYIIDAKNILGGDFSNLRETFKEYDFKSEVPDKLESLKEKVKAGNDTAVIAVDEKGGTPYFDYWIEKFGNGPDPDKLSYTLQKTRAGSILKNENVPESTTVTALSDVKYNVNELGKGAINGMILSYIVIMLLFFAIYFFGYGVAMSIASEKTSRVMEILVTSTKPSRIVLGKSVAMGVLGLSQLLLIVIAAVVTYKISFPPDFTIGGMPIDFSNFSPAVVAFMFIYFILGYSLYAMMNAVAGATVSKAEDVNSAIMPINMVTVIAFYFAYASVAVPEGPVAIAASLIPFSAPFATPCRLLATDVPAWQLLLSIIILIVTIAIMAFVCIRLYSSAVLHYGKRLKLKELMKMSKQ